MQFISSLLDRLSEFLAQRKGLLPMAGFGFVLLNFILGIFSNGWVASHNLFLHLGILLAILGFMLAWAL
jgi:hypothetical protein